MGSSGIGDVRLDGQGVDALGDEVSEGTIHEPMLGQTRQSREARTADLHREMASFAGSGVACMKVAVVDDLQRHGRQRLAQGGLDLVGGDGHGGGPFQRGGCESGVGCGVGFESSSM